MDNFPVTLVILNGKTADNIILRNAVNSLRDAGYILHIRVTWEAEDIDRYVHEAIALNVTTLVAAGGDGTISKVAAALALNRNAKKRPALGILPLGTANDFATSAGIPIELDKALWLAVTGNAVAIDLALVNQLTGFINMATGGFGTRITTETPEKLKAALGGVSYIIHGLMRPDMLKADRCEIRGENFAWQGDALIIGIGNGRQAGGGQQLCPTARINDGVLNLRIFTGEQLLPALLNTFTRPEDNENIIDGQSTWFEITAPHDITFNLDGEPLTGRQFRIEIASGILHCRLPPDCPLLM